MQINDMSVYYGKVEAVKNINIEVRAGEIVSLLGANGAGKTTILNAISGLKRIASGEIWFGGRRIDKIQPQKIVAMGINHVPEGRRIFPYMTVLDNLKAGAFTHSGKSEFQQSIAGVYSLFPILKERSKQPAHSLSGGEQQMLAIGRALMARPKILLLDEPSMGLSPLMVQEISKVIKQIHKQGVSVLLVEQNSAMALVLANRGYLLQVGNIMAHGDAKTLMKDELVKKAYLGA